MPKLKNITVDEVNAIQEQADTVTQELIVMNRLLESNYADELPDPMQVARELLSLSQIAGRSAQLLLHKAWMQQQRAEIARLKAEHAKRDV